ncbi:MAG TPA: lipid-binding SYLF domain-containing protein [Candidatus Polarisedimenticolia bacterium]|nr:lipid-binding SYLF domain-containing protein [Candidatus Polarisedimenticolia bacterium]
MRKLSIALSLVVLMALSGVVASADDKKTATGMDKKDTKTLSEASMVLDALATAPDKGIPQELLAKAECVLIFPNVVKGAFVVGGKAGKGVGSCRQADGSMSAPAMYEIGGASIGFQFGGSSTDFVLLVMNKEGINYLLKDKFTIGGEASATAGPVGRTASANTDAMLQAGMLSWSRSKGLFAGASLDGAVVKPDKEANHDLYGRDISGKEILVDSTVSTPSPAQPLMQSIKKNMNAAAAKEATEG